MAGRLLTLIRLLNNKKIRTFADSIRKGPDLVFRMRKNDPASYRRSPFLHIERSFGIRSVESKR